MLLSTVTVSYNSQGTLPECLRSLAADTRGLAAETVVVDNASRDNTLAAITDQFPDVRRIANTENLGFARAVNQGIAATTGEFVLVMNPDCVIRVGAIPTLIEHLRGHPNVAVVGPRLEGADGALEYSARTFPDAMAYFFNRYSLLTRLFPNNRHSRRYLMSDWDHTSIREVDWLSGAFLLVRRSAIESVGAMDEQFFMFNEDVDWCRRMKLAGRGVVYVPGAVVVHHIGASRKKVSTKVIVERHRGMIYYFNKHHPTNPLVQTMAAAAIWLRAGMMLVRNTLRTR